MLRIPLPVLLAKDAHPLLLALSARFVLSVKALLKIPCFIDTPSSPVLSFCERRIGRLESVPEASSQLSRLFPVGGSPVDGGPNPQEGLRHSPFPEGASAVAYPESLEARADDGEGDEPPPPTDVLGGEGAEINQ